MNYLVKKEMDFKPTLNVHWKAGDVICDWDIDRLFSVSTKEFFILDGKIEEVPVSIERKEIEPVNQEALDRLLRLYEDLDKKLIKQWYEIKLKEFKQSKP